MSDITLPKKTVLSLPDLLQTEYPPLFPFHNENQVISFYQSSMRKVEKEWILSTLATVAFRSKKWVAVDRDEFFRISQVFCPIWNITEFVDALKDLIRSEEIELISYENKEYFVPTPAFASIMLNCKFSIIDSQ